MSDIVPLGVDEIQRTSTGELRRHLAASLTITARSLAYLAAIWQELERRGEDLSSLRTGLSTYLPQIADGTLDAEMVVRYAGQRMLLRAASNLPIGEQRRLVDAGHVEVAAISDKGELERSTVPLYRLAATDIKIVFGDDHIRSPEEQLLMRARRTPSRRQPRAARQVKMDESGSGILVGGRLAKLERILEALSVHYGVNAQDVLERAQREKRP